MCSSQSSPWVFLRSETIGTIAISGQMSYRTTSGRNRGCSITKVAANLTALVQECPPLASLNALSLFVGPRSISPRRCSASSPGLRPWRLDMSRSPMSSKPGSRRWLAFMRGCLRFEVFVEGVQQLDRVLWALPSYLAATIGRLRNVCTKHIEFSASALLFGGVGTLSPIGSSKVIARYREPCSGDQLPTSSMGEVETVTAGS